MSSNAPCERNRSEEQGYIQCTLCMVRPEETGCDALYNVQGTGGTCALLLLCEQRRWFEQYPVVMDGRAFNGGIQGAANVSVI